MRLNRFAELRNTNKVQNLASTISHSFNLILSFVLTPIFLNEIGLKNFGLYSVLISIITIMGVFDFGISNSQIRISQIERNNEKYQRIFSNAIAVLVLGSLAIFIIGIIFYYLEVSKKSAFQNTTVVVNGQSLIIICTLTAASMLFANFANRIRLARNRTFSLSFWTIAPNVSWLITLIVLKFLGVTSIKILEFSLLVPGLIALINFTFFMIRENSNMFLAKSISFFEIRRLVGKSRIFIYLQIAMIFSFQIDNLIAAHYLTLNQVGTLAISMKMISVPISVIAAASLPIWAQMASVTEKSDIRTSFISVFILIRRILIISFPISLFLIFFLPVLIEIWTQKQVDISKKDAVILVIWLLAAIISQPISMAVNGLELRGLMKIGAFAGTIANFLVSIFLCAKYELTFGTVIGSIIGLTFFTILPFLLYAKRKVLAKSGTSERV